MKSGLWFLTRRDWQCLAVLHGGVVFLTIIAIVGGLWCKVHDSDIAVAVTVKVAAASVVVVSSIGALLLVFELFTLWSENLWSLARQRKDEATGNEGQVYIYVATWSIEWMLKSKIAISG